MQRITTFVRIVLALAMVFVAAPAFADSPHFIYATASIDGANGDLIASFKEAGLGNVRVTYTLSATSCSVVYECQTQGGNIAPGQTVTGSDVQSSVTCQAHNGQITAPSSTCNLSLSCGTAPSPKKACPNGHWTLFVASAEYDGVVLTDETNGIPVNIGTVTFP